MSQVQRTRALLGPADPARDVPVPPPRRTAHELIAMAGAASLPRPRRPAWRRLVPVAAALAVAAGGVVVVQAVDHARTPPPGAGSAGVLVPIAYQFEATPTPARDQLRALADRLVDAPYDGHTGRYTYHDIKDWGDPLMSSENGRYVLGYVSELQVWAADDGSGRQSVVQLPPQYPDKESEDYWQRHGAGGTSGPHVYPLPAQPDAVPLPADRAGLTEMLAVRYGGGAVHKGVSTVYRRYAVPRQTRAEILRILADVPGYLWRGAVTDRAGRPGLAITFDDPQHNQQNLLIFDPKTGALNADELLTLKPKRISTYGMILATDRTTGTG